MGTLPDGMERWGVGAILKESARLLRKHYRLFLPFYLAFYLPSSIAGIFQTEFQNPSTGPLQFASVAMNRFSPAQGTDTMNEQRAPLFISWTLVLATNLLETLGLGAVAYIVAYIYSTVDSDDDRFIAQKVFKSLPHAFLRMWVTQLWVVLVMLLLYVFSFTMAGILYAIMSVAAGWSDPPVILLTSLILLPVLAGSIFLVIMFAFAQFIAVLEPENYGREALKRSTKMARAGRAGTIVAVFLIIITCSGVLMSPAQAIATGTLPLWEESTLIAFIGILNSVFGVYFGVVSVVMYFVYKSRFDAVSSSIPVFKRSMSTDSAENPSKPLIPGADHSKSIGEP